MSEEVKLPVPQGFKDFETEITPRIAAALSALVGRKVTLKISAIEPFNVSAVQTLLTEGAVRLEAKWRESGGGWTFLFPFDFARLLIQPDGQPPGDEASEGATESGLQELADKFAHLTALFENDLIELLGFVVKFAPASAAALQTDEDIRFLEGNLAVSWKVAVEGWGETAAVKVTQIPAEFMQTETADDLDDKPAATSTEPKGQMGFNSPKPVVKPVEFEDFGSSAAQPSSAEPRNLSLLMDINLPISIELGRTSMLVREVLELGPGSVIELDKLSGEPVDLYVNDKKFAKGEVVVIEENFGVRITELLKIEDRLQALR